MSLPTITVIGNIQKIETRTTQIGKNVTSVNISCGDKNAKGEWDNLYIKADFWEKQSDFVNQYFHEGELIIITGKLVTTNYTNSSGTKVYETKFLFPNASFVPKVKEPQQQQYNAPQPNQVPQQQYGAPQQQYQAPQQQGQYQAPQEQQYPQQQQQMDYQAPKQ